MALLNDFILNEGLKHLGGQIFENLDPHSLVNCKIVSNSWKELIDTEKSLNMLQIRGVIEKTKHNTKRDNKQDVDFFGEMVKKLNVKDFAIIARFVKSIWYKYLHFHVSQDFKHTKHTTLELVIEMACLYNNLDVIVTLVKNGYSIDCVDRHGMTPLHFACGGLKNGQTSKFNPYENNTDILDYLLNQYPSQLALENSYGLTPLEEACGSGRFEAVKSIVDYCVNNRKVSLLQSLAPLRFACWNGHLEIVKFIMEKPEFCSFDKLYCGFWTAIKSSNIEVLKAIKDYAMRANQESSLHATDFLGETPLYWACGVAEERKNTSILEYMLSDADFEKSVDFLLQTGKSPLKFVCDHELLEFKIYTLDPILEYAIRNEKIDIVKYIYNQHWLMESINNPKSEYISEEHSDSDSYYIISETKFDRERLAELIVKSYVYAKKLGCSEIVDVIGQAYGKLHPSWVPLEWYETEGALMKRVKYTDFENLITVRAAVEAAALIFFKHNFERPLNHSGFY